MLILNSWKLSIISIISVFISGTFRFLISLNPSLNLLFFIWLDIYIRYVLDIYIIRYYLYLLLLLSLIMWLDIYIRYLLDIYIIRHYLYLLLLLLLFLHFIRYLY